MTLGIEVKLITKASQNKKVTYITKIKLQDFFFFAVESLYIFNSS